jgi:hypothetical protein
MKQNIKPCVSMVPCILDLVSFWVFICHHHRCPMYQASLEEKLYIWHVVLLCLCTKTNSLSA